MIAEPDVAGSFESATIARAVATNSPSLSEASRGMRMAILSPMGVSAFIGLPPIEGYPLTNFKVTSHGRSFAPHRKRRDAIVCIAWLPLGDEATHISRAPSPRK